ncbi:chemotaxis protein CheW [Suttonella sp. R2A3]|uniref:chemotaxis protein CheW n=1 Tax=Suttonella sp. R2A3 TaxID=2908648 RepID=UPI001F349BEF|nr:chemotaxis protein CheW [Suttonella sp. R2A3]UJF25297.1 chemotaxis protein CheW [Suttonella sp. R2A3]
MTVLNKYQTAYDCLRVYVRQSKKVRQTPETVATKEGLYLAFYAGDKGFLVRSDQVLEITRKAQIITPLPFTAPWMEGLVNVRGDILFVLNFSLLVAPESSRKVRDPVYVVLGSEAESFMIKVDDIQGMRHFPEMIAVNDGFYDGVRVTPLEQWLRINIDRLLNNSLLAQTAEH